ncbi:hypothetical protein [Thioalkalivibrio sp. HK1]|uniref:hypothetical protein n=1 Tax=Thioalkalivibrio sp. HK1 TaxID=1469245 RepID=UPI000472041E|nr:hypothetical protein [Thioalkalivibrio sp. HK1]
MLTIDRAASNAKPALLLWPERIAASLALVGSLLMLAAFPGPAMGQQGPDVQKASIIVSPSGVLSLREGGDEKPFSIRLDKQPSADVTITLTKTTALLTLDKTTLTFTTENYSTPQIVRASAGYDDDAIVNTDTITLSATGGTDAPNVTKQVTINEPRSIPVSEIVLTLPTTPNTDFSDFDEGESKDIKIKLGKQPSSTVTLSLSKTNDDITLSGSTLSSGTLTFNTSNWGTDQTVTITAAEDADATDDSGSITLSVSGGIVALDVVRSIEIADDDGGIVLSNDAIELKEGHVDDREGTFTVKLAAPPASRAVLSVTIEAVPSTEDLAFSVSPATLTFTPDDYDEEQEVTVTALDDEDADHDTATVTLSVSEGITAVDVTKSVEVSDDDRKMVVGLDPIEIREGATATFNVTLSGPPISSDTVSVSSGDTGAFTVSPATLTFTSSNYDTAQEVTVTAVGDSDGSDEEADITLSHSLTGRDAVTKSVKVLDDDAEIIVSPGSVTFNEDTDQSKFEVKLGAPPKMDGAGDGYVYLTVTSGDSAALTVKPSTLVFSTTNYDTLQTVKLDAAGKKDADGTDNNVKVDIALSYADGDYRAEAKTANITITDVDGEILIDEDSASILEEGGPDGIVLVSLKAAPTSDAVLSVESSDVGAIEVSPATLTFTPANYHLTQAVRVRAVNDSDASSESATVTVSPTDGYTAPDKEHGIDVIDKDGIVLSATDITLTEEDDGSFYVSLGAAPASSATVSFLSGDTGAVVVNTASLTFDSNNYNVPQQVTVTAMDDTDATHENVTITLSVTGYTAPNRTMMVRVDDNDKGMIKFDGNDILTITEGDDSGDTFTVELGSDTILSSNATLSLTIDDPEDRCAGAGTTDATACPITITPSRLTFTNADRMVPQTVTVKARFDDDAMDEENIFIVVSATDGMTAPSIRKKVKVEEADIPAGMMIVTRLVTQTVEESDISNVEIEEGGDGVVFKVKLDKQPASTVTVSISILDDDKDEDDDNDKYHVSISPTTLTFPAYGWKASDGHEFIVNAVPDDDADDHQDVEIELVAEGGININPDKTVEIDIVDRFSGNTLIVYPLDTLYIDEGATQTLSVRLGLSPAEDTVISLSNDNDDITLSANSLVFTLDNWSKPQFVSLSAAVDADAQHDKDTITIGAEGFSEQRIDVSVRDHNDPLPVRAYALALPSTSVQDSSTVRVHCKQDTPCFVKLDCTAQDDGSSFEGRVPQAIPAHGALTLTAADIEHHTGASWSGKGRLGCALRSEEMISAQVWTRSGDGVLVNNSAVLGSVPEGSGYRVDVESIPSPDTPEESNLRIRCLAPDAEHCVGMSIVCFADDGTMYDEAFITVRRSSVYHLQSEDLVDLIGHRWAGMGLACEINSDHPFTVQVLTRTGGGGALVNNSATGRGR